MNNAVSHYTLTRKLGAGTYGEVHEAVHQHDPELRVAIKIVSPALVQDPQFVDALKRECRQLDRLRHPNIVAFRDLLVDSDRVAMVLELLRGQDLHDRLAGGPIPFDTAVSVVEAILDGLGHAHAAGVLHRDIKPGNVYWCDDGRVVLLDFGIARAADGTQATKTGHMVGTFDYMAPERLSGSGGTASSDVYAVGLIAWELLRGRAACPEGEIGRKLMWHMVEGVGDASRIAATLPGCPSWLAEVIAELAAKDPSARPADGHAALALLREKRASAFVGSDAAPAVRRLPPATVSGPVALGSLPPVAGSVPPVSVAPVSGTRVAASVPPVTVAPVAGRSAAPGTVMGPLPLELGASTSATECGVARLAERTADSPPETDAKSSAPTRRSVGDARAWLIAATPILSAGGFFIVYLGCWILFRDDDLPFVIASVIVGAGLGSTVAVRLASIDADVIGMVCADVRIEPTAAVLPLRYLMLRRVALGRGMGPIVMHVLVCIAAYGYLLLASGLLQ